MITVKVDHSRAREPIFLPNNVPKVDVRVRLLSISYCIATVELTSDRTTSQVVWNCLSNILPLLDALLSTSAEKNINDDFGLVVNKLLALSDSVFHVDVCCSGPVYKESLTLPVVRWEDGRDGGRTERSLRHISVTRICLIKSMEKSVVDVDSTNRDPATKVCVSPDNRARKEFKEGGVVDHACFEEKTIKWRQVPILPDVGGVKVQPEV